MFRFYILLVVACSFAAATEEVSLKEFIISFILFSYTSVL